jgi:hypothetical protein
LVHGEAMIKNGHGVWCICHGSELKRFTNWSLRAYELTVRKYNQKDK